MTDFAPWGDEQAGLFVGRDHELALLLNGLHEASTGRGGLFVIGGEPGIGKSRLADEMSARAREEGVAVLWGRCWEGGGAPAYWPWVQCLRAYVRTHDQADVVRHMRGVSPEILQIMPELSVAMPELKAPAVIDSESARFRLFDATTAFLRNASADEVLMMVVDDLQVADTPSLLLLRFLASQLGSMRVVILATYRDVELTPEHPATTAISEMDREPTTHRVRLRGLGIRDIALLAQRGAGLAPPSSLVVELHRRTSGNPLFVGEAIKLLASEGGFGDATDAAWVRVAIPGAVKEVITRRLGHLGEACRNSLALASILGPEIQVEALRRLAGVPLDELLLAIDEAVASGLLIEMGAIGRYRYSHDLVREAVYDGMSTSQRVRLHLRAGEVLEDLYAADLDPHLGEVAHHFFEALPSAEPAKVRDYARRAGEHAARQLAYEEAVRLYRMALQAMELDDTASDAARCDLLIELGDAEMRAGDSQRAKETFLGAAAIARRLDSADRLARAALGYGGRFVWARAANDRNVIPLLRDALRALGEGDTVQRARVLARLAGALRDQPQAQERSDLSSQAVAMARRLDDPATLAYALDGRFSAIWAPDTANERLDIANEIISIAEKTSDLERDFQGRHYRLAVFLETGDIPAARAELDGNARLADRLKQPAQRWYVRANMAVLALLEGRFADAEALISDAFDTGREAESVHALGVVMMQHYALRREQGRAEELEKPLRGLLDEYAFWPWIRSALLHLYSVIDRRADARSLLEVIAGQDFRDLPWDNDWLMGVPLLADVAVYLKDTRRAELLYDLLLPYADRNGYGHPEFSTGSVSRSLGMLAGLLGRAEDAERHFEYAQAFNRRMGALPWVARTEVEHARVLLSRTSPGDEPKAREMLDRALLAARDLGMTALEREVIEILGEPTPVPPEAAARARARFRREGEYWTLDFGGDSFRLRDAKGLRYLARLLAEPGREILALDLVRAPAPTLVAATPPSDISHAGLGVTGAQLDEQAKSAYRERLHELQAELDEAEAWSDPERAERARSEMDFIARELARAVGLGGRDRIAGSPSERARLSATRAIRLAMKRIAAHSRTLADHLENSIHTGTYCVYRPDPGLAIAWDLG